jgi:hypothetical protein
VYRAPAWELVTAAGGLAEAPTDGQSFGRKGQDASWQAITKTMVGLANVDNTSDANKPVSTAQAAADALRVLKAGDTMTGALVLPAAYPTLGTHASNKTYVDDVAALKAPQPLAIAGIGQFIAVNGASGAGITLPAGGTWWYAFLSFNMSTNALNSSFISSINAGGSLMYAGSPNVIATALCWRIA